MTTIALAQHSGDMSPDSRARSWPGLARVLVPLGALLVAGLCAHSGETNVAWFRLLNGSVQPMLPDAFWACVTVCGDALIAMAVLAPFIRRRPELVFAFLAGGIMTAATVHSIKPRLRVPRPAAIVDAREIRVIGPVLRGRAFPSGHSATAFLAAGIVAMGTARGWVFAAALAAAALVALSRVVVGAHWPADVVAGAAIGWSGAWLGLLVARHWRWGWTYPGALACGGMCLVAFVAIAVVDHTGYGQALAFQRVVGVAATVWGCWEYARLAKIVRPAAGAPAVATETSAPR